MGQVPLLEQFETRLHFQIDCYLEIDVSREEAVARMTGRRVCPKCGDHLPPDRPTAQGAPRPATSTEPGSKNDPTIPPRSSSSASKSTTSTPSRSSDHYQATHPDLCRKVNGNQPFDAVYAETRKAIGA